MKNILSNIKERILYLAENVEVSKQEFFKKIEITYGNFTGDKKNRPVNSDAIENILLIYPQTNPEWLLTGNGPMLKEDNSSVYSPKDNPRYVGEEVSTYGKTKKTYDEAINEISQLKEENKALMQEKMALMQEKMALMQEKTEIIEERFNLKEENTTLKYKVKELEADKSNIPKREKTTSKKERLLPTTNIPIDKSSKHTGVTKNR
ncbi:TPA: hypothetical protein I9Y90_000075 [Elizabethkingia anophelis]|nr:hypothetical protein [Elizabethkingia anophelis]HAT4009598.1 hypothetical protein [Elizabethkingia anophelis]